MHGMDGPSLIPNNGQTSDLTCYMSVNGRDVK